MKRLIVLTCLFSAIAYAQFSNLNNTVNQGSAGSTAWPVSFPAGSSIGIQTGQSSVLAYPGTGATFPISSGQSLSTFPAASSTWPVSGNFWQATQPISGNVGILVGASAINITQFGGQAISTGTGTSGSGIPRITVSSDSFPTTQSISIASGGSAINQTQINGVTVSTGNGAVDTGTQRMSIATGASAINMTQFGGAAIATGTGIGGSGIPRITVSSDSFPATQAVSLSLGQSVGIAPGFSNINLTQINGVAIPTGTGAGGSGIQRVTVSSDSSLAANQSVNVAQMNGIATSMGIGTVDTGTQRVSLAAGQSVGITAGQSAINITQLNGQTISTGSIGAVNAGTLSIGIAAGQSIQVQIGQSAATTNITKGASVSTASTSAAVITTYTVSAGKTFYISYIEIEGRLNTISATDSILGTCFLQLPQGTSVANFSFSNATTGSTERTFLTFPTPLFATSGQIVQVSCTPLSSSNITWFGNFGGYER